MPPENKTSAKTFLLPMMLIVFCWGSNFTVMKAALSAISPIAFRALSALIAMIVLVVVMWPRRQQLIVPRRQWASLALYALFVMVVFPITSTYGIALLPSGRAAILCYTMPIWAVILSVICLKEPINRPIIVGLLLGATGIFLLIVREISRMAGSPLGLILMLTSAIVWSVATIVFKRAHFTVGPAAIAFWTMALGLLPLIATAVIFEGVPVDIPPTVWAAVAYNAIVIFIVCQMAWFKVLKIAPATISSLATLGVPVVSVVVGFAALDETPAWSDVAGLTLILISLSIVLAPWGSGPTPRGSDAKRA